MKILQINQTCGHGSTGKIAVGIGEVLREQGHESYIAYGYFRTALPNTLKMKHGNGANSPRIELMKCRLTSYFGFTSKRATYRLLRWIDEVQPDVIHLHNIHGGFLHIEVLFEYLSHAHIPIVWTLHDCWSFTGHCSHFDLRGCEKWKTGCYDCPEKESYPKRYWFDRSKEQWERKKAAFTSVSNLTFVTPSDWLKHMAQQSYFKGYPILTIHNGIDFSLFQPAEREEVAAIRAKYVPDGKKIILAITPTIKKGYRYLPEIARMLGDSYQLLVIGLNKKMLHDLPSGIIGMERCQDQKKLAAFYSAADVFINPTLEEALGLTNIEALACGTPVVTFATGGSPECLDDSVGMVVPRGDSAAMAEAARSLAAKKNSMPCREFALQRFNEKKQYQKYIDIYEGLVK